MPVKEILLLRHGHRLAWTLDPTTGKYTSSHPYPTRLPADPPLASHGVRQAQETGEYLEQKLLDLAKQNRLRIYSSLFYRCLETLRPTVERLRVALAAQSENSNELLQNLEVRGERGIGEWFGHAWFEQPMPATPSRLHKEFFPWIDTEYQSRVVPDRYGEKIGILHSRIAKALTCIIHDVDNEYENAGRSSDEVTLLVCGHAAQIICSGRALTGNVPDNYDEEDFSCYTCGVSRFVRRGLIHDDVDGHDEDWRTNGGIAGGWDCVANSDCSHLSQGAERGWHFHGDESFDSYGPGLQGNSERLNKGLGSSSEKIEDSNEFVAKL